MMGPDKKQIAYVTSFFLGVFCFCCYVFYVFSYSYTSPAQTDFRAHIVLAARFGAQSVQVPHPFFHFLVYHGSVLTGGFLSLESMAILLCAGFYTLYSILGYCVFRQRTREELPAYWAVIATAILLVVSGIYCPVFNRHIYLGISSPNIWHNPTVVMVKPFAVSCCVLLTTFYANLRWQGRVAFYGLFAFLLLLSLTAKPNFVIVFLPAVILFILIRYSSRKDIYWKTTLLFLPVIFCLAYQYWLAYASTESPTTPKDQIVFTFFGVWECFAKNIPVAILQALAFPIVLSLYRIRQVLKNDNLILAWLMVFIGLAEQGFLAEKVKFTHGNFFWGYAIALSLLFIFSLEEFLVWIVQKKRTDNKDRRSPLPIAFCSLVLSLHFLSGSYYLFRILTLKGYY